MNNNFYAYLFVTVAAVGLASFSDDADARGSSSGGGARASVSSSAGRVSSSAAFSARSSVAAKAANTARIAAQNAKMAENGARINANASNSAHMAEGHSFSLGKTYNFSSGVNQGGSRYSYHGNDGVGVSSSYRYGQNYNTSSPYVYYYPIYTSHHSQEESDSPELACVKKTLVSDIGLSADYVNANKGQIKQYLNKISADGKKGADEALLSKQVNLASLSCNKDL